MSSNQTYSQRKRAAILDAAAEEFRAFGFKQQQVQIIASAVDMFLDHYEVR